MFREMSQHLLRIMIRRKLYGEWCVVQVTGGHWLLYFSNTERVYKARFLPRGPRAERTY